jgi:hypothetical protein
MRRTRKWSIGALVLVTVSCGRPYFAGPDTVRRQIEAHEAAFVAVLDAWAKQPAGQLFCRFGEGEYRWGVAIIRAQAGGYAITGLRSSPLVVPTLGAAAEAVGTSEQEIRRWSGTARDLFIYCIKWHGGYAELELQGSEAVPYGARYVPPHGTRRSTTGC